MMRISVLLNRLHETLGDDLRSYIAVAKMVDEAGLHALHLGDQVIMSEHVDRYPYGAKFPVAIDAPWLEPLTALAAMASVTNRVRLSTGIVNAPLRPAALFAKTVATLDVLSGGRLDLGIGAGWQREQYEAEGLDFATRNRRMDDLMGACRALWTGEFASFHSETVSFERLISRPKPLQQRLPVWYGVAASEINAARIARYGDGWCPVNMTPEETRAGIARIAAAYRACGRDPKTLEVRMSVRSVYDDSGRIDIARTLAKAPPLLEAGVTLVGIGPPTKLHSLDEFQSFTLALAKEAARY